MDVDAYSGARREDWQRLSELVNKRRLNGSEVEDLIDLYRQSSADLSVLVDSGANAQSSFELASLVGQARAKITGTSSLGWAPIARFFTRSLPYSLYKVGPSTLFFAIFFIVIAVSCGAWALQDPSVLNTFMDEEHRKEVASELFESYYSENPAHIFHAMVWTNNAKIAVNSIVSGVTGIIPLMINALNAYQVGLTGAVMIEQNAGFLFFSLILPHGILELSCIFLSTATGWKLFWALVNPGPRSRATALAQAGRELIIICVALIVMLAAAGALEAYITPAPILWWVKILIGLGVFGLFVAYAGILGRKAKKLGLNADLDTYDAGYSLKEIV